MSRLIQISPALLILLAGCGGGGATAPAGTGGGAPVGKEVPAFFSTTHTDASTLAAFMVANGTEYTMAETGDLDRANSQLSLGAITGTVNDARTLVELDLGGQMSIAKGGTDYVAAFTAQNPGGNPMFGVVGVPTELNDRPTGVVNYSGSSAINAVDGTGVYELTGSVAASADFGSGLVDMQIHTLSGTRLTGTSTTSVNGIGSIMIDNAQISGTGYSGGAISVNSGAFDGTLNGSHTFSNQGGFFGPGATEIGGVMKAVGEDLIIDGAITAD